MGREYTAKGVEPEYETDMKYFDKIFKRQLDFDDKRGAGIKSRMEEAWKSIQKQREENAESSRPPIEEIEAPKDPAQEIEENEVVEDIAQPQHHIPSETQSKPLLSFMPKLGFTPNAGNAGAGGVALTSFDNASTANAQRMRKMIAENNMKMFPRHDLNYNNKMSKLRIDLNKNIHLKGGMPLSAFF